MTTPVWEAGKLYLPGSLVRPVSSLAAIAEAPTNADFEAGDTGWTKTGGWIIENVGTAYSGAWDAACATTTGDILNNNAVPVLPGKTISATAKIKAGGTVGNGAAVFLNWYDAGAVLIRRDEGTTSAHTSGLWEHSTLTATAPAGTATVRIGVGGFIAGPGYVACDSVTWSYTDDLAPSGLIFEAVQPDPGTSGTAEPAWPSTLGVQVVDNTVTWEAVNMSRVVWEASPIMQTGATEPAWPTTPGAFVLDGTVSWECISRRVEDENCPNTKVVYIIGGKVHAVDGDITRFCATANPLDWTTPEDAGYLPTGLQSSNANDMAVLSQYGANLIAMNANCLQNWQADPNPAAMALLDQKDGIGSTWNKAAQPVANDLFFLSQRGVRSLGIAAGADNLAAGDIGMPIDVLVQQSVASAILNGDKVLSTYYPGAGQYWLAFSNFPHLLGLSGSLADGYVGDALSATYTASNGSAPYNFAVSAGAIPTGMSLVSGASSCQVTGTATAAGTFEYTILVTDALGNTAAVIESVTIGPMTLTGDLGDGDQGSVVAYSYTATHGVLPRTYSIVSGALPGGLSINASTGEVTGTRTTSGVFSWTVQATDDAGNIATVADTSETVASLAGAILLDAPILYWKLNETAGAVVTDYSGNGRHGSYVGTENTHYERTSNGIKMLGVENYPVQAGVKAAVDAALLVGAASHAWAMLLVATRHGSPAGTSAEPLGGVFGNTAPPRNGHQQYSLSYTADSQGAPRGRVRAQWHSSNHASIVAQDTVAVADDVPHLLHLVGSDDAGDQRVTLYMDGALVTTAVDVDGVFTEADPTAYFSVGGALLETGSAAIWNVYATIAHAAVFNDTLTAGQALAHAQAGGFA